MAIVVGLGEILWDIFTTEKVLGGAPCNFALHSRALGADSYIISSVGNDRLGDEIKEILDSLNQKYYFTPSREKTGAVLIDTDSEGVASYIFRENCAYDNIVLTPEIEDLAKKTDCVCFGSLAQRETVSRESIYKFLDLTPSNCITIVDMN